jgi:putative copper resistance protein D
MAGGAMPMEAWLTAIRALHFTAAIVAFGQFAFASVVAPDGRLPPRFGAITVASVAVALVTALAWLAIEAGNMSGLAIHDALREGTIGVVLTRTQFGHVWIARAALLLILCIALTVMRFADAEAGRTARAIGAGAALLHLAALAGAGHAAAEPGAAGFAHLCADGAHLLAAGAWLGALLPFALLLRRCAAGKTSEAQAVASDAALRFSALGQACVGVLVLTGIVNVCYLVPNLDALFTSRYGRELVAKLGLFVIIVLIAAFNRMRLVPPLVSASNVNAGTAVRALVRNASIEMALGLAIVAIVANLGITMPPMRGG